jgi:hypothetical protein
LQQHRDHKRRLRPLAKMDVLEPVTSPFAVQKVQKLNFQGGLRCGPTVL